MLLNRWLVACVLFLFLPLLCVASVNNDLNRPPRIQPALLDLRQPQLGKSAVRNYRFTDVAHAAGRSGCEISREPEPLATPDPLLDSPEVAKVSISFIVGTDGRVHSAYILQSGGSHEDRAVLRTVRSWRYRPAMCNGVPTEAEAKIQFSSR